MTGSGSTWSIDRSIFVGGSHGGTGELTIADGGKVSAGGVMLAQASGSTGTLNIGAPAGAPAVAPGTLDTPSVVFGAGTGAINFNHTATDYLFAPTISGHGAVNLLAGTTTLTGTNTYTGGTAINGSTLAVAADANLGGAAGRLTFAGGTLQFSSGFTTNRVVTLNAGGGTFDTDGNNATLVGAISGSGSLTKIGAGVLTLSGANTYTGGTTLAAGTLSLANSQVLGTGALTTTGSVVDYANGVTIANPIVVNSNTTQLQVLTGSATQAGLISEFNGPRPLEKIGAGALVLTGNNTYSGPTTITAGLLQLGNGGTSGSILGNVVNNAIFAVNRSDTFTLSNVISGTGAFQQNGTGATVLTGTNTYTGSTSVNAGALVVHGSIANSAVTVANGAMLAGTGAVGATTVNAGGVFAPGVTSTPGTMTVAGSLAFQSGAVYLVQVNPSTASSTNVTAGGSATLAGTARAAFVSGSYVARTYTILSAAGGLNGTTFNALSTTNLPAGFNPSLSYTATDAILNLTATLGQPSLGTGGLSGNQLNVANALNNFFNNSGTLSPNFVTIFGLTEGNLANALSQLSGEAATGAQKVGFQLTDQFLNLMLDPFVDGRSGVGGADHPALGFAPERNNVPPEIALAYASVFKAPTKAVPAYEPRWTAWGGAYGGSNRTTGDIATIGSHDLSARTAGAAGGFDYRLTPNTVVGLAFAGGGANWSLSQGLGGGKSDAFQAGIYGATKSGPAYLAAAFAFANHWMSTDRLAFGDHLTADFNAQSYGGRLEGGYRFGMPYGGITPYAAIQVQNFHTPGYTETGLIPDGFALAFGSPGASWARALTGFWQSIPM